MSRHNTIIQKKRDWASEIENRRQIQQAFGLALGDNLKSERERQAMTINDVAEFVGMTSISLIRIENNASGLRIGDLILFSDLFDKPLAALLPNVGQQGRGNE